MFVRKFPVQPPFVLGTSYRFAPEGKWYFLLLLLWIKVGLLFVTLFWSSFNSKLCRVVELGTPAIRPNHSELSLTFKFLPTTAKRITNPKLVFSACAWWGNHRPILYLQYTLGNGRQCENTLQNKVFLNL